MTNQCRKAVCLFAVLPVLASVAPLRAQIMSLSDFNAPGGHDYVIGLVGRNSTVLLVTPALVLEAPINSGTLGTFNTILDASAFIEVLDTPSSAAIDPLHNDYMLYSSRVLFVPSVTTIHIPIPHSITTGGPPSHGNALGMVTFDAAGSLYYFQADLGVQKFANGSYTSPTLTFGTAGGGTLASQSYGLVVTNNVAYALDLTNNRIARFDATNGSYLGAFAVTGDEANSRIAVSSTGRLYLTTGNGGGNIYDATTGATITTFAATAGTPDAGTGGRDALFLDDTTGYLYTFDPATGMHTFYDPAAISAIPEPATYAVTAGLAAFGLVLVRRRRVRSGG